VKIAWLPKIVVATAGAVAITFLIWLALRSGWLDFMIPRA
jgi:hypothetical protein